MSICRYVFYNYNKELFPKVDLNQLGILMLDGLRFDLSTVLLVNSLFLLFFGLPFLFQTKYLSKFMALLWLCSNLVLFVVNLMDTIFFPFALKRSTFKIFAQFGNETNLTSVLLSSLWEYFGMLVLGFVLCFVFSYLWFYFKAAKQRKNWSQIGLEFLSLAFLIYISIISIRGGVDRTTRPISLANSGRYVTEPRQSYIVLNTPFSIARSYGKEPYTRKNYMSRTQLKELINPVKLYKEGEKQTGSSGSSKKPNIVMKKPNIVIFIMESFAEEFIGELNGGRESYTPFFDSLLRKSLRFSYSQANGKQSIDVMPAVLAGIPSLKTHYMVSSYGLNHVRGLPELLKESGYSTSFFHGAPNGSFGFQAFAKLLKIDRYFGFNEYGNSKDQDGYWGIWDHKFIPFFAKELGQMNEPFFSTIFTLSSHHPYIIPESYKDRVKYGPTPLHKGVSYLDIVLKDFFEKAQDEDWFKNTLFVFTADHTPSLPHLEPYGTPHGLYSIPIAFYHPGGAIRAEKRRATVDQIDIMPSVLDFVGYDKKFFSLGDSVFGKSSNKNYAVNYYAEAYQIVLDNYFMRFNDRKNQIVGFYDYSVDPNLESDLQIKQPSKSKEILEQLKAFIQSYENRMISNCFKATDVCDDV